MILCADDFGIAPDVDDAILQLVAQRKLSAVSVMASLITSPTPALAELLRHRDHLDIGLHLTLTDEPCAANSSVCDSLRRDGRFLSYRDLFCRTLSGGIRAEDVRREISAQFERFEQLTGFAPDYVDGHRHVQQLPVVRRELIALIAAMPAAKRPYVRNAAEPTLAIFRRGVTSLKCLGIGWPGRAMKRELIKHDLETNDGFGGVCDYGCWQNYPDSLRRFVQFARSGNYLIMAHPGLREDWRRAEYEGLLAAKFPDGEPRRFVRKLGVS